MENAMTDKAVDHPSYYNDGSIEVIRYIEDKKLGFHLGNAVKYISRAGKKDPNKRIEDIKKAIWYLQRYVEMESTRALKDVAAGNISYDEKEKI